MFHVSPHERAFLTLSLPPFLAKLAVCLQIHWIYNDERIGDTKEMACGHKAKCSISFYGHWGSNHGFPEVSFFQRDEGYDIV